MSCCSGLSLAIDAEGQHIYLCRYARVGHLGPFEAPEQIAERVRLCFKCAGNADMWAQLPRGQQLSLPSARL